MASPTAKARLVNLVIHSPCSEEISSQCLGSLVNQVNDDERKGVGQAPGNLMFIASNIGSRIFPSESTGNWGRRIKPKHKSEFLTHKEICCIFTRVQKHEIHEPSIHEPDLSVSAEEIGNVSKQRHIRYAIIQNESSMKSSIHLEPDFLMNSEIYRNTKIENIENAINILQN